MSTPPRRWFPLAGPDAGAAARDTARAAPEPIDPLDGPRLALSGRVVTMNDAFQVLDQGVVYVERGAIVDVRECSAPCPTGFESVRVTATGGTIYPGLSAPIQI
jgi:5-methylthioadenosine/S-adenosylhomocysteine deaminase